MIQGQISDTKSIVEKLADTCSKSFQTEFQSKMPITEGAIHVYDVSKKIGSKLLGEKKGGCTIIAYSTVCWGFFIKKKNLFIILFL